MLSLVGFLGLGFQEQPRRPQLRKRMPPVSPIASHRTDMSYFPPGNRPVQARKLQDGRSSSVEDVIICLYLDSDSRKMPHTIISAQCRHFPLLTRATESPINLQNSGNGEYSHGMNLVRLIHFSSQRLRIGSRPYTTRWTACPDFTTTQADCVEKRDIALHILESLAH
jgi:hypothetical protein